uniref:G-protein coupled receptors family 1 profile domain-containing protein n=1 Tax=Maylandia zebra TaxID=106582 RepID=A0A3P9CZ53_9CICH
MSLSYSLNNGPFYILKLLIYSFLFYFRKLHTPSNILLLSLAVSDFLMGLLLMPAEILRSMTCWVLGDLMCSVYFFLTVNITCASIGNIVLISIDRYVAICDPLHYSTRITVARVKLSVCLCWFYSTFYCSLYTQEMLIEPGRYNSCYGECVLVISDFAGMVDLILFFILPLSVIIVLYTRVFVVAVSQRSLNQTNKSELKAARTLGVLVVVFLSCYCPFYCYSLTDKNAVNDPAASSVIFIFYFNSCINPLIYALFYPWFRNAVKLIITLQIFKHNSCEANIL